MLLGPPYRPRLPYPPGPDADMVAILQYLKTLDRQAGTYLSAIVSDSFGMLGVKGLSSSGIPARNFVKQSLAIGGQTSASWNFSTIEANPSYLIFYSPTATTGMVMTGQTRTTTSVIFTFNPAVSTGLLLDVLLLR